MQRNYHESIPMATFGTMCLIAGLLAFYLPETKGFNLPESIEEIEGQKQVDEEKVNMTTSKDIHLKSITPLK